jgi:hypothetical protein
MSQKRNQEGEMKCPHCQKEISESGFVYCPHCGKQLEPTKRKGISLRKGGLLAFILWVGITIVAFGLDIASGYDKVYGYRESHFELITWAPIVSAVFVPAIAYAFGVWAIYTVAKRHGHNTVRWTTAAIIFSPVLAWAAYGLTWRKSQY